MNQPPWLKFSVLEHLNRAMAVIVAPCPDGTLSAMVPSAVAAIRKLHPVATGYPLACIEAGLWLLADDLTRAHQICQDIPTSAGSAWHAVMHRREGDFGNSRYWWDRTGKLNWTDPRTGAGLQVEILRLAATCQEAPLRAAIEREFAHRFDPSALTGLVERFVGEKPNKSPPVLADICRLEWLSLFGLCMNDVAVNAKQSK